MKNAKKILGILLALVALTLVMSLSIFAEESTGTVYEVDTKAKFDTAFNNSVDGDTIKLTADIDVGTSQYVIKKAITIDLNGCTFTTANNWTTLQLYNYCSIVSNKVDAEGNAVRGTVIHTGNTCAIKVFQADKFENINVLVDNGDDIAQNDSKTRGGIVIQSSSNGTRVVGINSMKNVTIGGLDLTNGIETSSCGDLKDENGNPLAVIGYMENVTVNSQCNGLWLSAPVGTVKNCTFAGEVSGIQIDAKNGYSAIINLDGCTVSGGEQAVNISDNGTDGKIDIAIDEETTLTSEGNLFKAEICNAENINISALTNGHNYAVTSSVAATCIEKGTDTYTCTDCGASYVSVNPVYAAHAYDAEETKATCEADGFITYTCSVCGDTYQEAGETATGHSYAETSRVEATAEADGYIEYTCSACQGTKREVLVYCAHNFVVLEEVKVSCLNDGYAKSECSLCGEIKEETIAKEAHTYDWKICGCPKCGTVAVPDTEGGKVSTNLGYTVFFAASWQEIANNVSASSTYDVIRLTADSTASSYAQVKNANILIDLGGHTITTTKGVASIYLYASKGLVNGTLAHNCGRQALFVYNTQFIEDINIIVGGTYANNATGIMLSNNGTWGSYIGKIKNVTIDSIRDENGNLIDNKGLYNHGIEFSNTASVIGELENVKVYSRGQAITLMAKEIGTMTNCVFSGDNIGMAIGRFQCDVNLVNCVVSSETLAVLVKDATAPAEGTISFTFDADTSISSNGGVYFISEYILENEAYDLSALTSAVALVNGQLYKSLNAAIEALVASTEEVTTFTLIGDLDLSAPIEINKVVRFSYGGGTFKIPNIGDKTFTEETLAGYTVTAPNGAFTVVEGGNLTLEGDGTLVGNDSAIVANGGEVLITAGTYDGYNPQSFVSSDSCVANNDGVYTIAKAHTYDDGVLADKVTYNVDGVCNVCGYVRGVAAVNYVYYATIEEALAAALETGYQIVLAADIVLEGDVVWDLTGATFNFNSLTVTVNGSLSIVGGSFTQDVSDYVSDEYCTYKSGNYYVVVDAHTWVDATCTAPKTCSACGATEGEALGHSYFYACDKVCQVCFQETNPDATHTIVHVDAVAATCTSNGNVEYWYCSVCGSAWTDEALTQVTNQMSIITPAGHTWGEYPEAIVPATCVSTGIGKYICYNCWSYDEERGEVVLPIDPTAHNEMTFNSAWNFAVCPDCDAYSFYGGHNGVGENELMWYFFGDEINICMEDYSVDEYYNYTIAYNEETGVYTVTLIAKEDGATTYAGCTATIVFNDDETLMITLTVSEDSVLVFGKDPSVAEPENYLLNGVYAYYDMGGNVLAKFEFDNGVIYVLEDNMGMGLPESFGYNYYPTTGVIETPDVPTANFSVMDGTIYFGRGFALEAVVEEPDDPDPEEPEVNYGDKIGSFNVNVTDTYTWIDLYTYTADVAGQYSFYLPAGLGMWNSANCDSWPTINEELVDYYENTSGAYLTVDLEAGETYSFYVASTAKGEYTVDVYYYSAHTHTEEVIPAVLPTPSVTGYTAGVKCSECGEIIVAPVEITVSDLAADHDFRFRAINLSLGDNISINYKANVPAGYTGVYTVFLFDGYEFVVTEYDVETSTGRYVFNFAETRPQLMSKNIVAYVYGVNGDGEYVRNVYNTYSVMTYCINQLKKNDAALTKVISDVLVLGAETQKVMNQDVNALVTDLVMAEGYTLTPTAFTSIPDSAYKQAMSGTADANVDWKSAGLSLGGSTEMVLKFVANDLTNLQVKVVIDNLTYYYDADDFAYEASSGRYVLNLNQITVLQFDVPVIATFEVDGVQVGRTLQYSINTYLQKNYTNAAYPTDLIKALYVYGKSVTAYVEK